MLVFEAQRKSALAVTAILIREAHQAPLNAVAAKDVSPRECRVDVKIGKRAHTLCVQWTPEFDVRWKG